MSIHLQGYLIPILNAASVFGRILPGIVADRFGRMNTTIVMTMFTAIIDLALWLPAKSNVPIITFTAFYGFGSGAFVSLAPCDCSADHKRSQQDWSAQWHNVCHYQYCSFDRISDWWSN